MSASTGTTGSTRIADRSELDDLVVVRRNAWLSGVVGGLALLVGVGYLTSGSGVVDVAVGAALLALAAVQALTVASARTPVLVADRHGLRLRVGPTWRGVPWGSVRQLVVERADSPLRESRLVVVPRDAAATVDHAGLLGRVHLRWNRLWYGAPLSVPLGITTIVDSGDLVGDLTALADARADVVQLRGRQRAHLEEVAPAPRPESAEPAEETPELPAAELPVVELPVVEPPAAELPAPPEDDLDEVAEPPAPEPVAPVRPLSLPARVEVRLDVPATSRPEPGAPVGQVPPQRLPDEVAAPDLVHADTWEEVLPEIAADDLAVVTPPEPVIGPKIARARDMLDMSIEELSERTRIRPHVLEAIELDDFGPCGGDFYARGHLTTIARVLGLNLDPLMADYDARYAGGPINARRVFEAELATGLGGGIRATRGGPQWGLLIAAVLCLTLVWGVARLLAGAPEQVAVPPATTGDSAGLAANRQPITSPLMKTTPMTVTAAHAGTHVVVRDRTGKILWSGDLRMTQHRRVVGLAPFKVSADNAGAIEVTVRGEARGTLGTAGEAGSKRFD